MSPGLRTGSLPSPLYLSRSGIPAVKSATASPATAGNHDGGFFCCPYIFVRHSRVSSGGSTAYCGEYRLRKGHAKMRAAPRGRQPEGFLLPLGRKISRPCPLCHPAGELGSYPPGLNFWEKAGNSYHDRYPNREKHMSVHLPCVLFPVYTIRNIFR